MDPGRTPFTVAFTIFPTPGLSLSQTPSDQPIVRWPSAAAIEDTHGFLKPWGARKYVGYTALARCIARVPSIMSRLTYCGIRLNA